MIKTARQRFSLLALLLPLATIMLAPALTMFPAAAQQDLSAGRSTGLPVPRFVSLDQRQDTRSMCASVPGQQYPINWVFTRPNVPLKIIAEFDNWRKIEDYEGAEGWIASRLLSGASDDHGPGRREGSKADGGQSGAGAAPCRARRHRQPSSLPGQLVPRRDRRPARLAAAGMNSGGRFPAKPSPDPVGRAAQSVGKISLATRNRIVWRKARRSRSGA